MDKKENIGMEESAGVPKRKGIKFAFAEKDDDMKIVSMIEFKGEIFVASQKGVYKIVEDKLVRLIIVEKEK